MISDTTNRMVFVGNGSSTVFPYAHQFFNQTDLKVYLYSSSALNAQTLNTNYTITGTFNAQGIYTQGGGVVTTCAVPVGSLLVVTRDPSLVQNYQLLQNGNINSVALTQQLDYLTLLCQRLDDRVDRTMILQDGSAQGFDPQIPFVLAASSVLITNSTATGWTQGPQADQIFGAQSAAIAAALSATNAAISAASASADAIAAQSAAVSAGNSVSLVGSTAFWGALAQSSALSATNNAVLAGSAALSASNSAAIASSSAVSAGNQGAIATSSAVSAGNNAILAASAALSASNSAAAISLPLSVANGGTGTGSSFGGIAYLGNANAFTASSVASVSAMKMSGAPFTGGSATTTKPHFLIEDAASSTNWNTSGTYLGINTGASFTGRFVDFQVNAGSSLFSVSAAGVTNHQQLGVNNTTGSSCVFIQTHDINKPSVTVKTLGAQVANVFEILNSANAPQFVFDSGGNFKFAHNTAAPECRIDLRPGRSTASTNAGSSAVFSLYVGDATLAQSSACGGGIAFGGSQDGVGTATEYGYIWVNKNNSGSGDIGGSLHFATRNNSTAKATRCLEMTSEAHLISFGNHVWGGGTSGGITHVIQSSVTSHSLIWPSAVAAGDSYTMFSTSSGILSWGPVAVTNTVTTVSANYNALVTDAVIVCNSSNYTVNLYGTSGNSGKIINIKKTGASTAGITIAGSSATIDGSSVVLDFKYESVVLECDGTNWQIRDWYQPGVNFTPTLTGTSVVTTTNGANGQVYKRLKTDGTVAWKLIFNLDFNTVSTATPAVAINSGAFSAPAYYQSVSGWEISQATATQFARFNVGQCQVSINSLLAGTQFITSGDVELVGRPVSFSM